MRSLTVVLTIALMFFAASVASALSVGDKAPELSIAHWANGKGAGVAEAAKKKRVLVVEFWATWCPPCKKSIPHLSSMYDELEEKGLDLVGVSREDKSTIVNFVNAGKPKFTYNVGVDDNGKTYAAYMKGVSGIPHAFVIDKTGTVVWQGHPMDGMEQVIRAVLAGDFDVKTAKELEKNRAALKAAIEKQDAKAVNKAADRILEMSHGDNEAMAYKRQVLREIQKDAAAWKRFMAKRREWLNDDAKGLAALAEEVFADGEFEYRAIKVGVSAARRALKLDPRSPLVKHTVARMHYALGDVDAAIALERKAAAIAKGDRKKLYRETLAHYESIKRLATAPPEKTQPGGAKSGSD